FRERVHDDVRAELDWTEQHRGRNRVVDNQRYAVLVGNSSQCLDVAHVAGRVPDALAEDRLGTIVDQLLDRVGAIRGGKPDGDALTRKKVSEQGVGRAIELRHGYDVAAHVRDVQHGIVDRRLS